MRTRPLQKNRTRFGQRKEMDAQTPKATSNKTSGLRASGHGYPTPSADSPGVEVAIDRSVAEWHMPLPTRDGPLLEQRYKDEQGTQTGSGAASTSRPPCTPPPACPTPPIQHSPFDISEKITQMFISMHASTDCPARGVELAEAFCEASEYPPITTQSLSELDIQNIITNVRLRHDVNFDRDLSFRPNLDGARGQAKQNSSDTYWTALVAELQLYAYISQKAPVAELQHASYWPEVTDHVKRRIPVMFHTIRHVLKSLVPDRDYGRVDELLDVPMLMQEIERGVCDMVRLAECMAQLLKEHCAPMRDRWVDQMVKLTKKGAFGEGIERIVDGLRELFAILEVMKLDVANHQIRNLKTPLIEESVNFQKRYHLDRLITGRSRINIDAAQAWYLRATWDFTRCFPDLPVCNANVKLEVFVRTVVAQLFDKSGRHTFPETFLFDQDRLRALKAEIEDLVHLEVCMDAFAATLKQSGHQEAMTPEVQHRLRSALLAIMSDMLGCGSHEWIANSEALSLEILRQASHVTGQPASYSHDNLSYANSHLLNIFRESFQSYASRLEGNLLERVTICASRNFNSHPMDLFNNLVPVARCVPPQPSHFLHLQSNDTSSFFHTINPETAQWQDIANRITHIILLHWRIWERIAYVQVEEPQQCSASSAASSQPQSATSSSAHAPEHDAKMVTTMKTGEAPEPGPDAPVASETSSQ